MTLAHLLHAKLLSRPTAAISKAAVRGDARAMGRTQAGLAQRLRNAGLQPGDRVGLFMRNHPRYLEMLYGAWWAGLVVVPVNAKLHPREANGSSTTRRRAGPSSRATSAPGCWPAWSGIDAESAEADALLAPLGDDARAGERRATTWPGCSTPAAPPAGPRA